MAAGDVFTDMYSAADDAELSLRPADGAEVVINNIYYAGAVEIYRYDGTLTILFYSDSAAGCLSFHNFRCTYGDYIKVKNVNGATAVLAYDGVYTKAAA
jgi:hypothetical protein